MLIEYENRKGKPTNFLVHIVEYDNPYDQRQEWFQNWREIVPDPALARALGFYNICHQSWGFIERGKTSMHCGNTTFAYHNEFNEHMKVEERIYEGRGSGFKRCLWLSLWCWSWKILIRKRKEISSWVIWEMGLRASSIDEDFDDYPDNDGLKNIIRDEDMQNLNNDD